jgi:hypothetical protein
MPSKLESDEEVRALYCKACANGYPASLLRFDSFCIDMCNWDGDPIKAELLGFRWHEFIAPRDLRRLLRWIQDPTAPNPIVYRGLNPKNPGHLYRVALSKVSGPQLRLLIGNEKCRQHDH